MLDVLRRSARRPGRPPAGHQAHPVGHTKFPLRIRRHTPEACGTPHLRHRITPYALASRVRGRFRAGRDRKSVVKGKSVSVRVDIGCGRLLKKKITSKI